MDRIPLALLAASVVDRIPLALLAALVADQIRRAQLAALAVDLIRRVPLAVSVLAGVMAPGCCDKRHGAVNAKRPMSDAPQEHRTWAGRIPTCTVPQGDCVRCKCRDFTMFRSRRTREAAARWAECSV